MSAYSVTANRLQAYEHDPGPLAPVLGWVDERFGPIRYFSGRRFQAPLPRWWVYHCQLARPLGEFFTDYDMSALGASLDPSQALLKALGEAVERYNCLNSLKMVEPVFEEMSPDNPLYGRFPICADFEQCSASLKHPPTGKLTQVSVKYLADDREILIPASYVHMNFLPRPNEAVVAKSITTGSAFHQDLFKAIWSGLLECAERDAIMLTWWNRRPAARIVVDDSTGNADLAERIFLLKNAGLKPHLFDISSDFNLPTVFCLLEGKSKPYWSAGASCSENPLAACSKAIDEAVMILGFQDDTALKREIPSFENFDWIKTLHDRSELYLHWKNCHALDFLLQTENVISEAEFCSRKRWRAAHNLLELRDFARQMSEIGLTALWSDLTIDDVKDLGYCIKVLVPEMVPLSVEHRESFLATPRLAKAAGKEVLSAQDINPYPHPFA